MTSRSTEYFKAAANGAGALVGALITGVGVYQASYLNTSDEKAGGVLVLAFLAASEYKFIRDAVRHVSAARAMSPANDRR